MFQAETEDMLPRAPPKPSAELEQVKASAMPAVPEVSIVFGQQTAPAVSTQASSTQNYTQETYASWKKKILPSTVGYAAETLSSLGSNTARSTNSNVEYASPRSTNNQLDYVPVTRSTLFPMRAAVNTISTNPPMVTSSHADAYQYRRSWDNPSNAPIYGYTYDTGGYVGSVNNVFHPMYQQQRRSLDAIPARSGSTNSPLAHQQELLTICAGTQTDGSLEAPHANNFATQQDMEQLLGIMQEMHAEQVRMRQLCEALVMQKQQQESFAQAKVRDAEVQCDLVEAKNVEKDTHLPLTNGHNPQKELSNHSDDAEVQLRIDNFYKPLKAAPVYEDSSQRLVPAAQSTAYRPNTPRVRPVTAQQPVRAQQQPSKPTTEKSMAMNELALKYLPSDKLNELMQDMQLNNNTPPAAVPKPLTPSRELNQLEKGVNDLSNASYRYLKKYRLLPEEQQRQTTPEKAAYGYQSPYHAASPLSAANGAPAYEHDAMLDLEHLRNQPKYL